MPTPRSHTLVGWSPALLEREHALAELGAALAAARGGRGGVVLVEAVAGLGKTRLVERARRSGAQAGMTVLATRASELEREFPFGVVRQLFDPALAGFGDDERAILLDGAAAPAARAFGGDEPPPASGADSALAVLYGLYRLTVGLAERGPLAIAVDDGHWADLPSLRFLAFLAPRLEQLPVLLVVAARPADGEAGRLLAQLGAEPGARRVALEPLGPEAVARVLGDALGEPPDRPFADACHGLTGGNPFLLSELARTLVVEGIPPHHGQAARIRGLLPESVARSVLVRLAGTSPGARRLAHAVAILGDGCEPYVAAEMAKLDGDRVAALGDELRQAGILEAEPTLRFVHPLIRTAVYLDVPAGARSVAHRQAAELLDGLGFAADRAAGHLLATEPAGDAFAAERLRTAARVALDKGAPQPAVAYLKRVLREPLQRSERLDVIELLVVAAVRVPDVAALEPHEEELSAALTAEPQRLGRVAFDYATALIGTGRRDEGLALVERAARAADESGDLRLAVTLDAQLISYRQDTPAEAREHFARYEGRVADDTAEQRLLLAMRSGWASQLGRPATEAAGLAREAFAGGSIVEESPDAPPLTQAILVLARADDLDAAQAAADLMVESATRRGSMVGLTSGWFARACTARRRGDLAAAEADIRRVVDAARLGGFLGALPPVTATLIDVLLELDGIDEADAALAEVGFQGELPSGFWFNTILYARGRLRLAQGLPREAADDLLELGARAAGGTRDLAGLPAGSQAALALASLGDRDCALALAEEELAELRRWGAPSAVAEGLTALGAVAGDATGIALLEEAVALSADSPARLTHAAALVELGALLLDRGDGPSAVGHLRAGLDLARRCGAVTLAGRAAGRLSEAGEPPVRHTPIGADALTPAERRAAELAARGMTNREIAAALFVSVKTVESHLRAAYDKLGIASRRDLPSVLALLDP